MSDAPPPIARPHVSLCLVGLDGHCLAGRPVPRLAQSAFRTRVQDVLDLIERLRGAEGGKMCSARALRISGRSDGTAHLCCSMSPFAPDSSLPPAPLLCLFPHQRGTSPTGRGQPVRCAWLRGPVAAPNAPPFLLAPLRVVRAVRCLTPRAALVPTLERSPRSWLVQRPERWAG